MSITKSKSSPISVEDINFKVEDINLEENKKIENVFELIDKLPKDMQNEVFNKLMSYKPSNASKLSALNNNFAENYSYIRRLNKIKTSSNSSTKNLKKQIDNVSAIIGDLELQNIIKYLPVKDKINKLFSIKVLPDDISETADIFLFKTLAEAKEEYKKTGKKDFESKKQDMIEAWNFENSIVNQKIDKEEFSNLSFLQDKIKLFKESIIAYDKDNSEKDLKNIESFLKLKKTATYSEYIKSIRKLPLGAKVTVGI